ncbi:YlbF family regulator [Erysipelotrichaceae bacterium OttesenSCG-928-M19]|nr:YlbF family regulator [Erysipelotrichaceae bacterium OttesenSCG-928-M19]
MNAVEYKALQINKIIKETTEFKDYSSLRKSIAEKYELEEEELKKMQQEIVNLAYYDEQQFEIKKAEYLEKKDEFYQDPLIKKFIKAYYSLQKIIMSVKNIIETDV